MSTTTTTNAHILKTTATDHVNTGRVAPEVFKRAQDKIYGIKHEDWRDDFIGDGYVVVKSVISAEKAESYRKRMFEYLKSHNSNFDINDRSTWVEQNLPVHTDHNIYYNYGCSHEDFLWDLRTEPGVIGPFSKLWDTEDLLVSFDGFNVSFPNRPDRVGASPAWPHVDQSPLKEGLQCAQGIVSLSRSGPEDGSLVVLKGSHNLIAKFFNEEVKRETWSEADVYRFTPEEYNWFLKHGCEMVKLEVEPGDLILWDSRTIHWGAEPNSESDVIRSVVYASYTPVNFATVDTLKLKSEFFSQWMGTSHWAHDNLRPRRQIPRFADGTPDPRNRAEPLRKPEMNDTILRFAGVIPY
ncbi:unnamed protein product [Kuraishia capsulata CBS 1993]|uniref:Phytanoyl-CoA dioxygenase n=1 Tax=Kuraishia capsulata CBS 1993 TaxID=1382522 RepID=W6MN42_9ASCO|nr:uncharacterized protein KUCA_T00004020001 [Kuraishia capsulata CBS 1993]CDK28039.1 unnamed protein product [Kuraishia capsulata CBS 1993]